MVAASGFFKSRTETHLGEVVSENFKRNKLVVGGGGGISKLGFPYLAVFRKQNSTMRQKLSSMHWY